MRTGPARLLHRVDRSPHRLVGPDELHRHLHEVGFERVDVAGSLAGVVARFHATTPSSPTITEEQTP
jgi:predicted methyltransferase